MSDKNPIFSSTNQPVEVPNLFAPGGVTRNSLAGIPLGSVNGEVVVKTKIVGGVTVSSEATAEATAAAPAYSEGQDAPLSQTLSGGLRISAASLPLPTGAATSANQTTQITAEQAILANLNGSLLPYAADQQVIAYYGSTNNINTIIYKRATVSIKTRTFTYAGGGASNDDLLTQTLDT